MENSADGCRLSLKSVSIFAGFILLGLAGNHFNLPIGFNVHFIFGSIFCILILSICGLRWGLIAAVLTSSYTFILWNHPYAIIIFTAEILWIGIWFRRGRSNIILLDSFYWLCLGIPLVALFYSGVMHLDFQITKVIALKQTVNGIFNALIASIILSLAPLGKLTNRNNRVRVGISHILFQVSVFALMLPSLGLIMYGNYNERQREELKIAETLQLKATEKTESLNRWVSEHMNAARVISELGKTYPLRPSEKLQQELARIHELFPEFHNVFIGDPSGRTIAFHPPVNERGESTLGITFRDRNWFKKLTETRKPVISEVFAGRGGVFEPIISISVPLLRDDNIYCFGLGAANLNHLKKLIIPDNPDEGNIIYLTDENDKIIFSNSDQLLPLEKISPADNQTIVSTGVQGVSIRIPGKQKHISAMQIWRGAFFITEKKVEGTGWTFHYEYPIEPLQSYLYETAINNLSIVAGLFIVAMTLAAFIGSGIGKTHKKLVTISDDLPDKIARGEALSWPKSSIREISFLIDNFELVSTALSKRLQEIQNAKETLEETVAKRTEELFRANQNLGSILASSPIAISWASGQGEIEYINDKFIDLFGYTLQEIPTLKDWSRKAYPDKEYRDEVARNWAEAVKRAKREERDLQDFEANITSRDGLVRATSIAATWVDHRILVFFTDITERKELEAKTLQMARLAALGEMASGVAHEINNPIAGVIGCAELLQTKLEKKEHREIVRRILSEGDRIARIVKSLLATARPGSHNRDLFSLADCFENVRTLSQEKMVKEGIILTQNIPDDLPQIQGEQQHIEQILLNMISNASHALHARFPEAHPDKQLHIGAGFCDEEKQSICLEIRDQGSGIPKNSIGKIFDPFFTTKSAKEGTGLGLVVCYEIIKKMGGDIRVESEVDSHTTFTIEFPLKSPD